MPWALAGVIKYGRVLDALFLSLTYTLEPKNAYFYVPFSYSERIHSASITSCFVQSKQKKWLMYLNLTTLILYKRSTLGTIFGSILS